MYIVLFSIIYYYAFCLMNICLMNNTTTIIINNNNNIIIINLFSLRCRRRNTYIHLHKKDRMKNKMSDKINSNNTYCSDILYNKSNSVYIMCIISVKKTRNILECMQWIRDEIYVHVDMAW